MKTRLFSGGYSNGSLALRQERIGGSFISRKLKPPRFQSARRHQRIGLEAVRTHVARAKRTSALNRPFDKSAQDGSAVKRLKRPQSQSRMSCRNHSVEISRPRPAFFAS